MPRRLPRPWTCALLALLTSACLTPTDPSAGQVAELRIRARFAPGAEPDAMGVTIDSAQVVATPLAGPPAVVDTTVPVTDLETTLSWIVDQEPDSADYAVQLTLIGGDRAFYQGDDDVRLLHQPLGDAPTHDIDVAYIGPGALASVTVTPATATLTASGSVQQFTAVARDADGTVLDATFTWASSDDAVATADPVTGLVTAVTTGVATITATAQGVTGAATLTVALGGLSVEITPTSATIPALNATRQFTATARDGNGTVLTDAVFTWATADPAVASVDAAGLATGLAEGTTTVSAETGGVTATADLTVAIVTTIDVAPATATLGARGATQSFTATARDAAGDPVADVLFTWASGDAGIATVDPATGLATAVANGTTTIQATAGDASGSATLTVAQAATTIEVTPASVTLTALGATQQFNAIVRDANGNPVDAAVAWSTSDAAVASVDPTTGLATAVATGEAIITAQAGGLTTTAQLLVAPGGLTVEITPTSATLTALGATQQFTAVARDGNGAVLSDATVVWATRDPTVLSADQTGLATAAGEGSSWIVAAVGDAADSAQVLVAVATTVEVAPATAMLTAFGATQPFTATARDAAGAVIPGATFAWTSTDPAIASIDPAVGLATAVTNGTVAITASTGNASGTASLTVTQAVAAIAVAPPNVTLAAVDATRQFAATALDANGNTVTRPVTFSWTSTDPGVVTVDPASGLATAIANGTVGILAEAEGVTGGANLTVDQVVVAVVVAPASTTLDALGATQQLTATGSDANGYQVADATFAWVSSDPAVASVDAATGLVTAIGAGDAVITATADGQSGTATVTVDLATYANWATITAAPTGVEANNDDPSIITVQLFDGAGNPLTTSAGVVVLSTTLGTLDPVVDNGDGTYRSALRSGVSGTAVVTGTLDGAPIADDAQVMFTTAADRATITADPTDVVANSDVPSVITVQLFNADGTPRTSSGGTVALSTTLGTLSTVTDVGDGTYRANLWSTVAGTAVVTGTLDGASIADDAQVLFTSPVTTVEVSPDPATLTALGLTQQFTAVPRDADGNVVSGVTISWSSGNTAVATIDPVTGLATSVANGSATIIATADGVPGSATLTVAQVVASVEITPTDTTLGHIGETVQLAAVARDANGQPITAATFAWTTSDATIATVDDTGLVTALLAGVVTINATSGSATGSATVAVGG